MDKIEKIRQEIERRINILTNVYDEQMERKDEEMMTYYHGKVIALEELRPFLDTLSEEPDTPEFPETFEICLYDGRTPNKENCNECSTTCSVRKEEPDKSLEEAAEEYRRESFKKSVMPQIDGPVSEYGGSIKNAFIAGAEWQKQQDLAEMAQSQSPLSVAYANRCFENGKQAMKEQMLKDAVGAKVVGFDILNRTILLTNVPTDLNMDDKVRIVVLKAEE